MEKIHNIYINSTNKTGEDTNYNYNLYLSNYNIKIEPDEDAYLNITGFQSLNSFYNINDLSNTFKMKIIINGVSTTYTSILENGNYDIFEFQNIITEEFNVYASITYDKKKNKWNYIKTMTLEETPYTFFIMPTIYNYKYFGLKPDIFTEIPLSTNDIGLYSDIINMNNFSLIVIKVLGLVEQNKCIDNFNKTINKGDTACIINRQDVQVGALINWTSLNNSFMKKISNLEINQLTFLFYNEFNQILTDLNDWVLTLQLIIEKKPRQ
jgi:hypothetical protein